ncbi:MAG: divergent polysaccharide deacetylase family protein [Proteobacteria bacterium]|nr:divergent polysaccharide deacetylase family protein [Pseudomonadota bacterium]
MSETPPPVGPQVVAGGRWIGWVFAALLGAVLGCFAAAVWLAKDVNDNEPGSGARALKVPPPAEMPVISGPTEVPLPYEVSTSQDASTTVEVPAAKPAPEAPLWVKNAAQVDVPAGAPMLALVIDDMGVDGPLSARALQILPPGVTFSFLAYGRDSARLAREARAQGHELLLHMPMEPLPHGQVVPDMGPNGLKVGMAADQIDKELMTNLRGLEDLVVGVNNHMGSRFTNWESGMRVVLTVLQREGLLFLDSRTSAPTATKVAAEGLDLPVLYRDVFLDDEEDPQSVRAEWDKALALAKKRGFAVAIGHPLPNTLDVLADVVPQVVSSGVVLVPLTYGMRR